MNKERRKKLFEISNQLSLIQSVLKLLVIEDKQAFEQMPTKLQDGPKALKSLQEHRILSAVATSVHTAANDLFYLSEG